MADENGSVTSGLSFADPVVAQRTRDAIRKIAKNTVQIEGTNPQVGRVMAVDIARLKASVWFTGDDSPIEVGLFPGSIPLDLGDYRGTSIVESSVIGTGALVYVEDFRGQPYVTKILSGGEYTLNQRVAGLTHQMFYATKLGSRSGPPVSGIYERHVNIKVPSDSNFTVGKALMVGPWAGTNDGSMIDGMVEIVLSWIVTGNVKQAVRKYEFSISDRMVVDLEGDEGNKAFWMRVLPSQTLATKPHAELALDVALVKTGIRSVIEFWIRLVPMDVWADQSEYTMSVKTFGSAFNVGDPKTGRIVTILKETVDPVQGVLGFHNSGMGFVERDEYPTWNTGISWWGDEWSTGPFRAAPMRAANDLRPLWRNTSQWFYGQDNRLFWEGNIVFTGIGANWGGLHTGSIAVPFPTKSIPIFPGAAESGNYRSPSGGILLNPGETLYYGLCPGLGSGGSMTWMAMADHFFIVDSKTWPAETKSFALPEWAIPIATRTHTVNAEARDFFVCNPIVDAQLDDKTRYCQQYYTASHGPFVAGDETETMELPSFRYKAKSGYKLSFKCGVYSSTSVASVMNFRWKKGLTAAGLDLGEHYRLYCQPNASPNAWGVGGAQGWIYILNDTNADIVTAMTLTVQTPASAPTAVRFAAANTRAWVRAEWAGPATKFAEIGRFLT